MEKFDQSDTKPINNRDCSLTSHIFKYQNDYVNKLSKYKYNFTNKNSSNSSNIFIKLIDCPTARRDDRIRSHHQIKIHRHRKTKQPICYRHFPFSFNALHNSNNIQQRNHISSINQQSTLQFKSRKDNETNMSITIQKISNKNIHSSNKVHKINESNKSILNLKEEGSQICLYRRISNDKLDIRNEQKPVTNFFISNENDNKSSVDNNFRQSSNTFLTPIHILKQENDYTTNIKLKISFLNELTTCIMHQSPLEAIIRFNIIPAYILVLINHMIRMSLIQIPSLPLIILESDNSNLKRYKSSLNIILIDNVKDQQKAFINHDQSRISDDFTNFLNKKYSSKDNVHHIVSRQERDNMKERNENSDSIHIYEKADSLTNQAFETLSSTNQPILEDDGSIISNDTRNDSELLLNFDELFSSQANIANCEEEQNGKFIVDYDQKINNENLIGNEESNYDLNLRSILLSNLPVDPSFTFASTIDGIGKQESILNSKSNKIILLSDQIHHRLISESKDQQDDDTSSSLLTERSHLLRYLQAIQEPPNANPTNVYLHNMFEQTTNQSSDPLLSTARIPKHSSTSLQTTASSRHDTQHKPAFDKGKANFDALSNVFITAYSYSLTRYESFPKE
ncbi:unnamed protein product [Rotaria sp. Silwood2]|nr:unnamed protein product [Rotaria sp. Silwood2]